MTLVELKIKKKQSLKAIDSASFMHSIAIIISNNHKTIAYKQKPLIMKHQRCKPSALLNTT